MHLRSVRELIDQPNNHFMYYCTSFLTFGIKVDTHIHAKQKVGSNIVKDWSSCHSCGHALLLDLFGRLPFTYALYFKYTPPVLLWLDEHVYGEVCCFIKKI